MIKIFEAKVHKMYFLGKPGHIFLITTEEDYNDKHGEGIQRVNARRSEL